jgi:uncharacterized membrane protein YccF (DUF307 family)
VVVNKPIAPWRTGGAVHALSYVLLFLLAGFGYVPAGMIECITVIGSPFGIDIVQAGPMPPLGEAYPRSGTMYGG